MLHFSCVFKTETDAPIVLSVDQRGLAWASGVEFLRGRWNLGVWRGCAHYFSIALIKCLKEANSAGKDLFWLKWDHHGKICIGVDHPHLWQREHPPTPICGQGNFTIWGQTVSLPIYVRWLVTWCRQSGSGGKSSQKHNPLLRPPRPASPWPTSCS